MLCLGILCLFCCQAISVEPLYYKYPLSGYFCVFLKCFGYILLCIWVLAVFIRSGAPPFPYFHLVLGIFVGYIWVYFFLTFSPKVFIRSGVYIGCTPPFPCFHLATQQLQHQQKGERRPPLYHPQGSLRLFFSWKYFLSFFPFSASFWGC